MQPPLERPPRTHPVHGFAARLHAELDRLATVPAWAMTPAEQAETLVDLTSALARIAELRLRVLVAGDRNDLGADSGASSTAAWLAHATRERRAACSADLRLAHALDEPALAPTREALAAGLLNRRAGAGGRRLRPGSRRDGRPGRQRRGPHAGPAPPHRARRRT